MPSSPHLSVAELAHALVALQTPTQLLLLSGAGHKVGCRVGRSRNPDTPGYSRNASSSASAPTSSACYGPSTEKRIETNQKRENKRVSDKTKTEKLYGRKILAEMDMYSDHQVARMFSTTGKAKGSDHYATQPV